MHGTIRRHIANFMFAGLAGLSLAACGDRGPAVSPTDAPADTPPGATPSPAAGSTDTPHPAVETPQDPTAAAPEDTAVPPTAIPSAAPTSTATATPIPPTSTPATGVLKREDPPPAGIEALLNEVIPYIYASDTLACTDLGPPPDRPAVVDPGPIEILDRTPICLRGFEPGGAITIQVALPDGRSRQDVVTADWAGDGAWFWLGMPFEPRGTYAFSATQGAGKVDGAFTVVDARAPRAAIEPASGPPGTVFAVLLAGYPPGQAVDIHVYRHLPPGKAGWRYRTSLATDPADARGDAIFRLRTGADDTPGRYRLRVVGGPAENRLTSDLRFTLDGVEPEATLPPRMIEVAPERLDRIERRAPAPFVTRRP